MERAVQNFNQLFKEYHNPSFLFAKSFVQVSEVAEDIVSEALMVMWERMQIEEVLLPKSFLFKVIKNKALDHLKHQKVRRKVVESIDDWDGRELQLRIETLEKMDEEIILAKEIREIALATLEYLPSKTKEVFVLSRHQQLSGKEIAEQLGITVKGVEYHMTKALKMLSVSLRDYLVVS
jgi:RNA polymerase sigma-70 factor (ECF subfamily)